MEVKELSSGYMEKLSDNTRSNAMAVENYGKLVATAVIGKVPRHVIDSMRNRKKRLESCNQFWLTETYEESRVKRLMQTYLCHDRFCTNCNNIRRYVMQSRFLPIMEEHQASLYHMVLTVPDCSGAELREVVAHMGRCFKTLVNHLNGNRKIRGLDFSQYGYQGCFRSLEVDYQGENIYHPHFHVAVVFENPSVVEGKHISNRFSQRGKHLFSEFEVILQRLWWLMMNRQKLTSEAIFSNEAEAERYSCSIGKFQPADYPKLFGYLTKTLSGRNTAIRFQQFRALYNALSGVRQIQGYGIFYRAARQDAALTEQEYTLLADYIAPDEQPTTAYEPLSRLADGNGYTILREKAGRFKV